MEITEGNKQHIIDDMKSHGWKCDIDNESNLGFVMTIDEDCEWIRDYDKKTGRFVQFNGKQKVNLRIK